MTEQANGPEFERREDPELQAISERLGLIIEGLGFVVTPEVAEAKAAMLHDIPPGSFDGKNQAHCDLLDAFHAAAEQSADQSPTALVQIGYQLAVAELWFKLDDPDRFFDRLDLQGETGVIQMLRRTPGGEGFERALEDALDALNQH